MNERAPRWELWISGALAAYWAIQLVYFATRIGLGVPPDETTHLGLSEAYANAWLMAADGPETYRFGAISHSPWLYHFMMGKLLWLKPGFVETHVFLRLWNVVLALGGLGFAWRAGRLLLETAVSRLLFLAVYTNVLLFTFVSTGVSYDNLVNLCAVASTYYLVRHVREPAPRNLLLAAIWMALGCLAKITYLPLVAVQVAALICCRRRDLARDLAALLQALRRERSVQVAAGVLGLCLAATALLYGGNLVEFGTFRPSCTQILPEAACMENRILARDHAVNRFRTGETDLRGAFVETEAIPHAGDREYARRLIQTIQRNKQAPPPRLDPLTYMHMVWNQAVLPAAFGVHGHRSMLRGPEILFVFRLVLLAGFLGLVRRFSLQPGWTGQLLLTVHLFGYWLFLLLAYHYPSFLRTQLPLMGVNGRYFFPVMLPFALLLADHLTGFKRRWLATAVALLVGLFFLANAFPVFVDAAGPVWSQPVLEQAP